MGVRKSCRSCLFYVKSSNYCLKLAKHVNDPDDPPCIKKNRRVVRPAQDYVQPVMPVTSSIAPQDGQNQYQQIYASPPQQSYQQVQYPMAYSQQAQVVMPQVPQEGTQVAYYTPPPPPPIPAPIPKVDTDRVSTGIYQLDELLGGGFLKGKTYLVAGETGCGKTIFSMQFLRYGAQIGEPGVYVAIDEPTDQLIRGLEKFGWSDIRSYINDGLLTFLDMRTHFSKIYMRDLRKRIEPKFIIESIEKVLKRTKARRLVIDPIAPLIYGGSKDDVLCAREFLREMVFALERRRNVTTIMTSEIPTGSNQMSRFGVEEFLASGILILGLQEVRGEIYRVMFIRKARWSPVKPSKYVFEIVQGQGIVIKGKLSEFFNNINP
ncbi:MAG: hypothetical protein DRJ55_00360 [Thermoprotei archaeon]|nr:MAG: hypothetical protein DRJ55_00360 [Thermoprotei archaeon]HDJ97228.1 hypothetical protein [Thermofilum sp.]